MTFSTRTSLWGLLPVFALVGCSSDPSDPASSDGGDSAVDGASPQGDSGVSAAKFNGVITIANTDAKIGSAPIQSSSVTGVFSANQANPNCTVSSVGTCNILDCTSAEAGTPTYLGAGAITIDVNGGAKTVSVPQIAGGTYSATSSGLLFAGGEPLVAKTTGDAAGAPAISLSLTAPPKITLTSPALPNLGQKLTLNRADGLSVAWTGGATSKVLVGLNSSAAGHAVFLSCTFDAASGAATIPPSVTGKLVVGNGSFLVSSFAETTKTVGDWAFVFSAQNRAVSPTQAAANGLTAVQ